MCSLCLCSSCSSLCSPEPKIFMNEFFVSVFFVFVFPGVQDLRVSAPHVCVLHKCDSRIPPPSPTSTPAEPISWSPHLPRPKIFVDVFFMFVFVIPGAHLVGQSVEPFSLSHLFFQGTMFNSPNLPKNASSFPKILQGYKPPQGHPSPPGRPVRVVTDADY